MAVAVETPTLHITDVLHRLIDKSGADEASRLDMHDAVDETYKDYYDGLSVEDREALPAKVDRLSSGVGGGAAGGLTKADLDKAVAGATSELHAQIDELKAAVAALTAAKG